MQKEFSFKYEIFNSIDELNSEEKSLLEKARQNTENAYAPYSQFNVSAVALLENGTTIAATNQENASYPVGICAERTLLSAVSSLQPNQLIKTMAISYHNLNGNSGKPISPCGICRQSLLEYENRFQSSVKIIMSGLGGEVVVVESAKQLLPFSFSAEDMK
ncbi:cytidine deaminase [Arachidicoccus ginsenosidimutans]|uniref:cytidine deaminase n=1 Tax=Arachidicoccus sp. BS20 TaxID=1850526 RepID=UPI0007F1436E|nr:cytidine deaminase [Arachidicoccus sp. BS20]ANI88934.1 cytidine deaminase [Arachidicoccus sp. BS20]